MHYSKLYGNRILRNSISEGRVEIVGCVFPPPKNVYPRVILEARIKGKSIEHP